MSPTLDDLSFLEKRLNLTIKPEERNDYLALLAATDAAAQAVMSMPDYTPPVNFEQYPRSEIYVPADADNKLRGWACKATVQGASKGILSGKRICLKDNICLAKVPCQFGTSVVENFVPDFDATIASRILDHGGTIVGKATCEDMSHGAASFTSRNGPVHNPHAFGFSAGGSSSGCGALISSGEVDMGVGGDQGGSIRIPAALCGIVGLKATFGLIPYTGVLSSEASLDHVGPMARTVEDVAILLQAVAGYDDLDDRQLGAPMPSALPQYISAIPTIVTPSALEGVKIGLLTQGFASLHQTPGIDALVRSSIEKFRALGAEIVEVSVPGHLQGGALMHLINKMGSSQARLGRATARRGVYVNSFYEKLLPWQPAKWDRVHSFVQSTAMSGEYAFHAYPSVYGRAMNIVRKLKEEYDATLAQVDVLIMPTVQITARRHVRKGAGPLACSKRTEALSQADLWQAGTTDNTAIFNGTGHPALTIPVGFAPPAYEDILDQANEDIKLPVGMQIVGRWWDETTCLKVGAAWEKAWDWKTGQMKEWS